jgi:hypothetical protein
MSVASILSGTPAGLGEYARVGVATIPAAAAVIAVADTRITATSVVMCWGVGAADATAKLFAVDVLVAGTGFSVATNANATAAKVVGYAVLKY